MYHICEPDTRGLSVYHEIYNDLRVWLRCEIMVQDERNEQLCYGMYIKSS